MDSLINAAGLALVSGDPLGALNRVALREDAAALALRGIAMAQLGDLPRARELLRRAARSFGPREAVAQARCIVAEAEIALACRDLAWPAKSLSAAAATLRLRGDLVNAAHADIIEVRRLLLIGKTREATARVDAIDPGALGPASRAAYYLAVAGLAIRRVDVRGARAALAKAEIAARHARIAALNAEVDAAAGVLRRPAARIVTKDTVQPVRLEEIEALLASPVLVIDACRYVVRQRESVVSLARRPVLFTLARRLAAAWPGDVTRATLIADAFGGRDPDESHRARLRVEIGRLRRELRPLATVTATSRGFVLEARASSVVILAPPVEDEHAAILALLADGEAWSSSALAIALGASQRSVQRALDALAESEKIRPIGRGRAQRWMTPLPAGFATTLLLPAQLTVG